MLSYRTEVRWATVRKFYILLESYFYFTLLYMYEISGNYYEKVIYNSSMKFVLQGLCRWNWWKQLWEFYKVQNMNYTLSLNDPLFSIFLGAWFNATDLVHFKLHRFNRLQRLYDNTWLWKDINIGPHGHFIVTVPVPEYVDFELFTCIAPKLTICVQ